MHFCIFFYFSDRELNEATFRGTEYLMYNLFEKSGEPILSLKDEISLYFRTNRPEGLLFYSGNTTFAMLLVPLI